MAYMLLIIEPEGQRQERGVDAGKEAYAQMMRYGESLHARGKLVASNSLASRDQATRLQVRDGKAQWHDGPYSEAKEMVGGFFLLNCDTRDEAAALALECPAAAWCTVEVREVAPCYQ